MLRTLISTALIATTLAKGGNRNNRPPKCETQCDEGFKLDRKACECYELVLCESTCDSGFKQDRETCECTDATTYEMKCPRGFETILETCECVKGTRSFTGKCHDGFELDAETCACNWVGDDLCDLEIKCPYGQGWDVDACKCDFEADCSAEPECLEGEHQDEMTCACYVKEVRGGK